MKYRITCACGHWQAIDQGPYPVTDADWMEDGWERVGDTWKCFKCLGKPAPANYLSAIRGGELEELDAVPEGAREDALDYLDRIGGG